MRALRGGLTTTLGVALAIYGCTGNRPGAEVHRTAATRLKPTTTPLAEPTVQQTVYVPVYSSMYLGTDIKQNVVEFSATVSVRNTSSRHPIVLNVVRYYDSAGQRVRDYIDSPSELAALATVEFVIQRADTTGGPGANFLVQWTGAADIDEPVIEAVMIGQAANAGFSFMSPGRVVKSPPP